MRDDKINTNILEIKLDQITPILHFQYDQYGATLRATEVKPKLDKFLLQKLKKGKKSKKKGEDTKKLMINPENNRALAYKLMIENNGEPSLWNNEQLIPENDNSPLLNYPPFFANKGIKLNSHGKELIYYPDGLTLKFFSFHKSLLSLIKENICEFFAINNFGTRQSKGFGSYYISSSDPLYTDISNFIKGKKYLKSSFPVDDVEQLFHNIDLFYRSIRSGAFPFQPDATCASAMYCYVTEKLGKIWDKQIIREVVNNEMRPEDAGAYSLYRDVLGLASDVAYGHSRAKIKKIVTNTANANHSPRRNHTIARFKSPIFIKPMLNTNSNSSNRFIVYVGLSEDKHNIIGYNASIQGSNFTTGNEGTFNFTIPSLKIGVGFELSRYMDYLLTEFKIENSLPKIVDPTHAEDDNNQRTQREQMKVDCETLKNIYKELQSNYKKICQNT